MRRTWIAAAVAVGVAAAVPSPVGAWREDGHRIVGRIAWRNLEPAVRERVADLLRGDDRTLARAATWADRLRTDPAWDWAQPFHYVNVPDGAEDIDLERDCPPEGCAVRGIEENLALLSDRAAPRQERLEALKFVAHFVGDVHQPLHAGYGSDRGGNEIPVTFFGEATDLHEVWDSLILLRRLGWPRSWSRRRLARRLDAAVTAEERRSWAGGTPLAWAEESLDLALTHAYAARPGDALGEAYDERNWPVIERRLQQAGLRLAGALSRALAGPGETHPGSHPGPLTGD